MLRTEILQVDPDSPQPDVIARAADVLARGGLVAFPTETVYGLGAAGLDASAVARIFAAKGRPAENPLILHVLDAAAARELVSHWPPSAEQLATRFWPGPLTLVLPKGDRVPPIVTAGGATVAIRAPQHPVARALLAAAATPIAAPSANLSTRVSGTRAEHVAKQLAGRIEMILDGGATPGGLESTVVDLTSEPTRVLRPGAIGAEELSKVLGKPVEVSSNQSPGDVLRSPGLLERHYAPRTPLECVSNSRRRVAELAAQGQQVGWLLHGGIQTAGQQALLIRVLPADARQYAAGLYAALHELDEAGAHRIVVERPPEGSQWTAIHDRLRRASAST